MRIKWLHQALIDIDAEMSYIAQEDSDAAVKLYAHIRDRIAVLEIFPESGRLGRILGTRELVLTKYPYIIPYRVKDDTIEILRIFHTRQKQPRKWA